MTRNYLLKIAELEMQSVCVYLGMMGSKNRCMHQSNEPFEKTEVGPYHKDEYISLNE